MKNTLEKLKNMPDHTYNLKLYFFASPVYWQDRFELDNVRTELYEIISQSITGSDISSTLNDLVCGDADIERIRQSGDLALFVPLSGGIQSWMKEQSCRFQHIGLLNAYLPDPAIPESIRQRLLSFNAHPAATDFHTFLRMKDRSSFWLSSISGWKRLYNAWQAVQKLRNSRLLLIGDTEPWVLNSCRDFDRFSEVFGVQVVAITMDALQQEYNRVPEKLTEDAAESWITRANILTGVTRYDVMVACRIQEGIKRLALKHSADGIAVGCFDLIRKIDTTSCLALSHLNSSPPLMGTCEGDLDAAVTMMLLRALGTDFLWMANPVIYDDNRIDLVHCTAPRSTENESFDYQLLRHHESGRGVSPSVAIPPNRDVTLARIGNDLRELLVVNGKTGIDPKLPTCRTQVRIAILSSRKLLDNLTGTHLVMTFGNWSEDLELCAKLLKLKFNLIN